MCGSSRTSFGTQTVRCDTDMGRESLSCSCMNTYAPPEPKFSGNWSILIGAGEREMGMGQVKKPQSLLLFLRVRHFFFNKYSLIVASTWLIFRVSKKLILIIFLCQCSHLFYGEGHFWRSLLHHFRWAFLFHYNLNKNYYAVSFDL